MTPVRTATTRHYLLCPPTYFDVVYAINPWMHPEVAVDTALAMRQWETLRTAYLGLGHTVELIDPVPGQPDMVFAANGGAVVDGRALSSRFRFAQRTGEQAPFAAWLRAAGTDLRAPVHVLEGEGDIAVTSTAVLLGSGFRSEPGAVAEVRAHLGEPTGRRVVGLELVDASYYHLDTALGVLDDRTAAYLPAAFSPAARRALAGVFEELIPCSAADAAVLGLNLVSDGRHVVLERAAHGLAADLAERGFVPLGIDMGELRKSGGAVKCCTMEFHGRRAVGEFHGLPAVGEFHGLPENGEAAA